MPGRYAASRHSNEHVPCRCDASGEPESRNRRMLPRRTGSSETALANHRTLYDTSPMNPEYASRLSDLWPAHFVMFAIDAAIVPTEAAVVASDMIAGRLRPLRSLFEGTMIWHPGSIFVLREEQRATIPFM